jgi:TolB-like protein
MPPVEQKSLSREEREAVRTHLRLIIGSPAFARSGRAREFLSLVILGAIRGSHTNLRERMIGVRMFGRPVDYDTGSDSVVRVTATEVRRRLSQFYLESGLNDWPVRFELPVGSYIPNLRFSGLEHAEKPALPKSPAAESAAREMVSGHGLETELQQPARTIGNRAGRKTRHVPIWIGAALLGVLLLFAGMYKIWTGVSRPHQSIRSILILPLKNLSGDPNEDSLADGMTAELINSLGQISRLRVISLTSSMNLKGSSKMVPEIARDLKVEGVVEGSVRKEGSRLQIIIELIDAHADRPIWAQTYTREMDSASDLEGEIAGDIVQEVTTPVSSEERARFERSQPANAQAHAAYLRGLLLLHAGHDRDACVNLRQAVQADSQFAPAHSALAECFGRLVVSGLMPNREGFSAQKSEALQAISLDPLLAEPHAELADAVMALDRDWQTAGKEYQRALDLNPNSAEAHQKYAIFLALQGKTREAINEVEIGTNLDPISAEAIRNQVFVYLIARQYDKVLSLIETSRTLGIDPSGMNYFLGAANARKGQYQASIDWYLKAQKSPHTLGHIGSAYALAGQKQLALKTIATLQSDVRDSGVGLYEIAVIYAGLGDRENALRWLKAASDAYDVGLLYIKVDPSFDPMRNEPEFQELVRHIGLSP